MRQRTSSLEARSSIGPGSARVGRQTAPFSAWCRRVRRDVAGQAHRDPEREHLVDGGADALLDGGDVLAERLALERRGSAPRRRRPRCPPRKSTVAPKPYVGAGRSDRSLVTTKSRSGPSSPAISVSTCSASSGVPKGLRTRIQVRPSSSRRRQLDLPARRGAGRRGAAPRSMPGHAAHGVVVEAGADRHEPRAVLVHLDRRRRSGPRTHSQDEGEQRAASTAAAGSRRLDDEQRAGQVVGDLVGHRAEPQEPGHAGHPPVADHQQVVATAPRRPR